MGWLATAALREQLLLRKLLGLPIFETDPSGGITQFLDANGNFINFGLPVYTNGYEPNPWDVPKYTEILTDPSCLTGSGANTQGIKRRADGNVWQFADGGQILYSKSGTVASPLVSGVAAGGTTSTEVSMWGSLSPIMIPAFMMYKGFRGRLKCSVIKTGATGTWQVWIRLGKTAPGGSITQNDQLFFPLVPYANASNRQVTIDVEFVITSAGVSATGAITGETLCAYTTKMYMQPNGEGTNAILDKGTYTSTVDDNYVNINIRGSTGDTFSLLDYSFTALPI